MEHWTQDVSCIYELNKNYQLNFLPRKFGILLERLTQYCAQFYLTSYDCTLVEMPIKFQLTFFLKKLKC